MIGFRRSRVPAGGTVTVAGEQNQREWYYGRSCMMWGATTKTMERIILFSAIAVELVFAAYCIRSRSYQSTTRSIMRIGAFAVFVMLTTVSVVEWSPRWHAFAALLLTWALLGVIAFLRKTDNGRTQKRRRDQKIRLDATCRAACPDPRPDIPGVQTFGDYRRIRC